MFWDNYVEACAKIGESPTGAMKKMGISTGNIHRWQNGGSPTGDMLVTLTRHLHCTADYLLTGNTDTEFAGLCDIEIQMINMYRRLPDVLKKQAYTYLKGLADANYLLNEGN